MPSSKTNGPVKRASSTRSCSGTWRKERLQGEIDAYACGPTPMIDAVIPILQRNGVTPEHMHFDKFTPAVR